MKPIYFTPGPSQLGKHVPRYVQEAIEEGVSSWSHRGENFKELFHQTTQSIREVMGAPKGTHVFFVGSGTEAMERTIQNLAAKSSFHFVNGSFSKRMWKISGQVGKNAQKFESLQGKPFDFEKAIIPKETELICFTHNETSVGVKTREEDITSIAKQYPHTLVSVDVVSSAPLVDLDWDATDCAFFSVQKCFGLPAGLGVMMVSERAIEQSKSLQAQGISNGSYHSFPSLLEDESKSQTPETPNVLGIFLLGKVCEEFLHKGINTLKKEGKEKSSLLYDFFDSHETFNPFIEADAKHSRSDTVIVAKAPQGSKPIISSLKQKGLIIGSGYAEYKESCMRIANFPAHSKEDLQNVIDALSEL